MIYKMPENSQMNNNIIVVNSTPIISLEKAGQLRLFELLYSKILIPEAVYNE